MPVPVPPATPLPAFPLLTTAQVDAARTSSWHELFEDVTSPATVIDIAELGERDAFLQWLDSESIFLPEDSDPSAQPNPDAPVYRLPKLNAAIRAAIQEYGAVFPKLNWTAPRDAAFLLPQGHGPLHCTTPGDVYLLLKSSDFVAHGLGALAYEGCSDADTKLGSARLELVLKKFEELNPAREMRCFVRDNVLLGITQRDMNFYDHLQTADAQKKLVDTLRAFWEDEVRNHYEGGSDYVLDVYMGEHSSPSIIDFAPYRASTDPLLFDYEDLRDLLEASRSAAAAPVPACEAAPAPEAPTTETAAEATAATTTEETTTASARLPVLKVVDSAAHPAASRAAPTFSTNMMPLEMLQMSDGRTLADFAQAWESAMSGAAQDSDSDDE